MSEYHYNVNVILMCMLMHTIIKENVFEEHEKDNGDLRWITTLRLSI